MDGETLNYKRHLVIPFRQYFQIHEEDTPNNSTRPRTRGAIYMGSIGSKQGGFKIYGPRINEKGCEAKLVCTPNACHCDYANERTCSGATQWSRLPWLQEFSLMRARYHRSGCWGNWSPTHWADRTRDWYRSYITQRRNTTRTSGTLRHTHYWTRTKYGYCKIEWKHRGSILKNWSSCAIIIRGRITRDHISGQDFYAWGNPRSAQIPSSKMLNQDRLNPKYFRQEVWNYKHPSGMGRYLAPWCSHISLPRTDWGIAWHVISHHDDVTPQGRHEALERKRASIS